MRLKDNRTFFTVAEDELQRMMWKHKHKNCSNMQVDESMNTWIDTISPSELKPNKQSCDFCGLFYVYHSASATVLQYKHF